MGIENIKSLIEPGEAPDSDEPGDDAPEEISELVTPAEEIDSDNIDEKDIQPSRSSYPRGG